VPITDRHAELKRSLMRSVILSTCILFTSLTFALPLSAIFTNACAILGVFHVSSITEHHSESVMHYVCDCDTHFNPARWIRLWDLHSRRLWGFEVPATGPGKVQMNCKSKPVKTRSSADANKLARHV